MTCTRRHFFSVLARCVVRDTYDAAYTVRKELLGNVVRSAGKAAPRRWLRPPGALPEERFLAVCTRCTSCQEACPYDAIRRLGPECGSGIQGTPAIIPEESPCYLCTDMPCIESCEPGALAATARECVSMGTAVVDSAHCYSVQGQPCDYCVTRCPLGRTAIRFGANSAPIIEEGCAGCGVCAYLCPARCISVDPL